MRLLPATCYLPVFAPLSDRLIGYVRMPGNTGDDLIEMATFQLFNLFKINYYVEELASCSTAADELVIAGGGSMGELYEANLSIRKRALATGKKVTVLPQSFTSAEPYDYHRVYVRETTSWKYRPDAILAPDLALGFSCNLSFTPLSEVGVWLRSDIEARFADVLCNGDPANVCSTVEDYLRLAGMYSRIITDRLHFAICGLIAQRHVTLLPNTYHKNRAMYDTWLRHLGCAWAETPSAAWSSPQILNSDVERVSEFEEGEGTFDERRRALPRADHEEVAGSRHDSGGAEDDRPRADDSSLASQGGGMKANEEKRPKISMAKISKLLAIDL